MNKYKCKIDNHGYVYCTLKEEYKNSELKSDKLHRILMNPPKGKVVDHINGNKKDNTRKNLRLATHAENMRNRHSANSVSKYKGVYKHNPMGYWVAHIKQPEGKNKYIGMFTSKIAAANAYNYWAKILFKDFAHLNEVPLMEKEEWEKYLIKRRKTSKYKGVSLVNGNWLAQIWDGKTNIRLGQFDNEIDAAKAYDEAATKLEGKYYKKLNFSK